jgi:hypothetical protein
LVSWNIMDSDEIEIPIKYQGLDADRHEIEIISLGQSLQGAGKLIKAAGSVVLPQRLSAGLRVVVKSQSAGCYELIALLVLAHPILPFLVPAAQKVIEVVVNGAIARFSSKPEAADHMTEIATTALQEMGMTSRQVIEAAVKISENNRGAVGQFITPVGDTCHTALIGHEENGALLFDIDDRKAIESKRSEIGEEGSFTILITELDLENVTCKFHVRGEREDKRYAGTITDPALVMPNNPYSFALHEQQWLNVRGKPEMSSGEMTRLYISNSAGAGYLAT